MPAFCGSCGKPLNVGEMFCPACGAKTALEVDSTTTPRVANMQQPTPAAVVPAAAPNKSGGSALKIVVVVLIIGAFLLAMVVGGAVYTGYRIKKKAEEMKQAYGIPDLTNAGSSSGQSQSHSRHAAERNPCSLITKEEMGEVTGIEVQQVSVEDSACHYVGANPSEVAEVDVSWGEGSTAMAGAKLAGKLAEVGPGTEGQAVPGLGDEAYFQTGMLHVRKGDDTFMIMLPASILTGNLEKGMDVSKAMAEVRDKEKTLAKKVLTRL